MMFKTFDLASHSLPQKNVKPTSLHHSSSSRRIHLLIAFARISKWCLHVIIISCFFHFPLFRSKSRNRTKRKQDAFRDERCFESRPSLTLFAGKKRVRVTVGVVFLVVALWSQHERWKLHVAADNVAYHRLPWINRSAKQEEDRDAFNRVCDYQASSATCVRCSKWNAYQLPDLLIAGERRKPVHWVVLSLKCAPCTQTRKPSTHSQSARWKKESTELRGNEFRCLPSNWSLFSSLFSSVIKIPIARSPTHLWHDCDDFPASSSSNSSRSVVSQVEVANRWIPLGRNFSNFLLFTSSDFCATSIWLYRDYESL